MAIMMVVSYDDERDDGVQFRPLYQPTLPQKKDFKLIITNTLT